MHHASGDADSINVVEIAERLEKLLGEANTVLEQLPTKSRRQHMAEQVESLRTLITRRQLHFDRELFPDVAWSMLLALFQGYLRNQPTSASETCAASGATMPTALRWLDALTAHGIVTQHGSGADSLVRLSQSSLAAMHKLFAEHHTAA